jgi:hypothetical protein
VLDSFFGAFVKKILFVLLSLFLLQACIFDSNTEGATAYFESQGYPLNYPVETLEIQSIPIQQAQTFFKSDLYSADFRAVLGTSFDLTHDLYLDFAFRDEAFFQQFSKDTSAKASLSLSLLKDFYNATSLSYKDSLPLKDSMTIEWSWVLKTGEGKTFVDSAGLVRNSEWYQNLKNWDIPSIDSTYSLKIKNFDSLLVLPFPQDLVLALQKVKDACHLQLKVSAPQSSRLYRMMGAYSGKAPILKIEKSDSSYTLATPFRMANHTFYTDSILNPMLLHAGGLSESLVVELPKEPILKALSEFYGDEFPYMDGDGMDVRQMVVLAQLSIPIHDIQQGEQNLGKPIQVIAGSFVDSLGKTVRILEAAKINKSLVEKEGQQNLLFFEKDSLVIQLTYGMRDFINRASKEEAFKFMLRLGYPVLQPYSLTYNDKVDEKGDSSYFLFPHFDYVKYDFAPSFEKSVNLKLWLASKRGERR